MKLFLTLLLLTVCVPAFAQVAVAPLYVAPVVQVTPPAVVVAPPVVMAQPVAPVYVAPVVQPMVWQAYWCPYTGLLGRTTWSVKYVAVPAAPIIPVVPQYQQQSPPEYQQQSKSGDNMHSLIVNPK